MSAPGLHGGPLEHLEQVDSTMDEIRRRAMDLIPGTVVVARSQTRGRGRDARSWESPPGAGLWLSAWLPDDRPLEAQVRIGAVAALATTLVLRDLGAEARLRWPNDIVVGEAKIAGLLAERLSHPSGVVQGLGLDLDLPTAMLEAFDHPVTDLRRATGRHHESEEVLHALLARWNTFDTTLRDHGFEPLAPLYANLLDLPVGRPARWMTGKTVRDVVLEGVNPDGSLRVRPKDGGPSCDVHGGEIVPLPRIGGSVSL